MYLPDLEALVGALDWQQGRIFWKIDYYDDTMQHLGNSSSPDCNRVLTIMLADEY